MIDMCHFSIRKAPARVISDCPAFFVWPVEERANRLGWNETNWVPGPSREDFSGEILQMWLTRWDTTEKYTGWWLSHPSEKKESQLGWWHSQLNGKTKNVPNHQDQPVIIPRAPILIWSHEYLVYVGMLHSNYSNRLKIWPQLLRETFASEASGDQIDWACWLPHIWVAL